MKQLARILLGLLMILIVTACGDMLLPDIGIPNPMYWAPVSTLVGLVAAFLGGLVARRRLLLPALVFWLLLWDYLIWAAYQTAGGTGHPPLSSILQVNVASIATSFAALVVGVLAGQWLAQRLMSRPVATA